MQSIAEQDLGTPKRQAAKQVTLTVDGREVTVPLGTSVLRADAEAGVSNPEREDRQHPPRRDGAVHL